MIKYDYKLNSLEETKELARKLAKHLFKGAVITLEGELGAGKTSFTKGLAEGLNITANVSSPTFTIIKEYEGTLPLYHIDAYRLNDLDDLGLDEYFFGEGVTVVEWASKIHQDIPKEHLHINFYIMSENVRVIEVYPKTDKYVAICEAVFND